MRVSAGRRSAVFATFILMATLIVTALGPAASAAKAPPGLARFMYAVGKVESGGNYQARNPISGAYGKYQIMPSNWPSWAKAYLGNSNAKQTPANQEKVAAGKFTSLYRSLDSWRRVAYWWLTGSRQTAGWSGYATNYVNRVMRLYRQAGGTDTAPAPKAKAGKRIGEASAAIAYGGSWKSARHPGYAGDKVRYATRAGATATLTFTGSKVTWVGPVGPTRGKARVYLDGTLVRTVDLYDRTFDARKAVFRKTWAQSGTHTLTIEVVGTRGRSMVAIDEFVVTP